MTCAHSIDQQCGADTAGCFADGMRPWETATFEGGPLTLEALERAYRRICEAKEEPPVEYHHPRCPKAITQGQKACRCGTAPLEAALEDDLEPRR